MMLVTGTPTIVVGDALFTRTHSETDTLHFGVISFGYML